MFDREFLLYITKACIFRQYTLMVLSFMDRTLRLVDTMWKWNCGYQISVTTPADQSVAMNRHSDKMNFNCSHPLSQGLEAFTEMTQVLM